MPIDLQLAKDLSPDDRIKCLLNHWVAVDANACPLGPNSRPVYLRRSEGHRKAGRLAKYWLHGLGINAILIEAEDNQAALEEARARL